MKRKNIIVLMISLSLVLLLGSSYALLRNVQIGSNLYTINVGSLQVQFEDGSTENLNVDNMYPISDKEGLKSEDELVFVVKNTGNVDATYNVYIKETSTSPEFKDVIRFASNKNDTGYNAPRTLGKDKYVDYIAYLSSSESASYKVKVWLDYNANNEYMSTKDSPKIFKAKLIVEAVQGGYREKILNGADPVLSQDLIPITIAKDGTVTKADIQEKWYSYAKREWANAIILVDKPSKSYNTGEVILESDIESYFVWIPRYKYKFWNASQADGAYELNQITDDANLDTSFHKMFGNARLIDIVFESKTTKKSEGTTDGTYLTHPAFTLGDTELSGIWVGKFETGYNQGTVGEPITDTTNWTTGKAEVNKEASKNIIVKPNVYSWRSSTVYNFFKSAYGYERSLESHMMKNTEWGAAAYLSHSLYGIGTEININNHNQYKTGYSAAVGTDQSDFPGTSGNTDDITQPYNTITGYRASTTGNITGIYYMAGGAHEYMASYRPNSPAITTNSTGDQSGFKAEELTEYAKYLDTYPDATITSYSKRILGDATGEMGTFYQYKDKDNISRAHNAWYADDSNFVASTYPWFGRGGNFNSGVLAGQFAFARYTGGTHTYVAARLVLANG